MVEASAWTLYDTPDHRLWQADFALVHRGHILALHRRSQLSFGKAEASQACRGAPPPRLLAQWPSSDLKTALLPLVRIRAIRAVLACTVERHTAILRDDLDKTVARVEAWLVQPDPASCRLWVTVEDLRGYERGYERERVAAAVALVGRGWYEAEDDPFALFATEILDIGQPVESGFPAGHKPAGQALRACLRQALQSQPDLEKGVVDDIDTEFLHQYRVILRRARSLVAQFRSVFPSKRAERIRAILGGWARCSNSQRDLDVWLLARSEHEALVPEQLRPGMEGLKAKRFWSGKADIDELIRASDVEGLDVLPAAIPVAEVVEESAVAGSSVALHAPRARVAQAYRRLHAEVEVILAGQDAA